MNKVNKLITKIRYDGGTPSDENKVLEVRPICASSTLHGA